MSETALLEPTTMHDEQLLLPDHTATSEVPKSPFDAPPTGEAVKDLGAVSMMSESPETSHDRVIRSYVNAEGKPLAGFNELYTELDNKVASGNETDWNNLVQTLRDAEKNDAKHDGVDVTEALETFEKFAHDKYKELQANYANQHPEKLSFKQRMFAKIAGSFGLKHSDIGIETVAENPVEDTERESLAYRAGYKIGQRRAQKQARIANAQPIDPPLAKQHNEAIAAESEAVQSAEVEDFVEVNEAELTKLSNDELKAKYYAMNVKDQAGIAKIVNELDVRDIFLSLDRQDEADVQRIFGELDQENADKEAAVQRTFSELDAENAAKEAEVQRTFAELDKENADKEAAVQGSFAELDEQIAADKAKQEEIDATPAPMTAEELEAFHTTDTSMQDHLLNAQKARKHGAKTSK